MKQKKYIAPETEMVLVNLEFQILTLSTQSDTTNAVEVSNDVWNEDASRGFDDWD